MCVLVQAGGAHRLWAFVGARRQIPLYAGAAASVWAEPFTCPCFYNTPSDFPRPPTSCVYLLCSCAFFFYSGDTSSVHKPSRLAQLLELSLAQSKTYMTAFHNEGKTSCIIDGPMQYLKKRENVGWFIQEAVRRQRHEGVLMI